MCVCVCVPAGKHRHTGGVARSRMIMSGPRLRELTASRAARGRPPACSRGRAAPARAPRPPPAPQPTSWSGTPRLRQSRPSHGSARSQLVGNAASPVVSVMPASAKVRRQPEPRMENFCTVIGWMKDLATPQAVRKTSGACSRFQTDGSEREGGGGVSRGPEGEGRALMT